MIRLIIALAIVNLLSGCGIPNPFEKKKSSNRVEYYVHGDPLVLLANTVPNTSSFLTPENLAPFDGFHLASAASFIEVEVKRPPQPFSEVEAENSTDADEAAIAAAFEMVTYTFVKISDTRYEYQPSVTSDYRFGFNLDPADGLLKLADINGTEVTVQHYSRKNDGKAFSLLFSYASKRYGKVLMSVVFGDSSVVNPVSRSQISYSYLLSDVKLKWEGAINVQGCGKFSPEAKATIQKSLEVWFQDPSIPAGATKLAANLTFPETYPPYSDLNSHCVLLIPDFRLENSDSYYTAGVTLPVINSASKFMFDADIMIFVSSPAGRQITGEASDTVMHEMGHFLGLGHEFRTDESDNALYPSIMGYSRGAAEVTAWDYAAVRDLYGAYLSEVPRL